MSGNKGRKIKDVENDIKNPQNKLYNLFETETKDGQRTKNAAVYAAVNNSGEIWHQPPGPMTAEKEAAKRATLFPSLEASRGILAEKNRNAAFEKATGQKAK